VDNRNCIPHERLSGAVQIDNLLARLTFRLQLPTTPPWLVLGQHAYDHNHAALQKLLLENK
jgi:hypothetical protein